MPDHTTKRPMRNREAAQIQRMFSPVRCTHCGGVYDLGAVEVTARYADCSMWKSPCCKRTVDDRPEGWKPRSDIQRIDKDSYNPHQMTPDGRLMFDPRGWADDRG